MGEMIAIRDAYGAALKELGEQVPNIVCLEADVASGATKRLVISDYDPLHPSDGTITYLDK